jgi:FemAB-related protein (PEP-CTERM system-associated)
MIAPHLAHAPEWASIIERSYGHRPLYLTAVDAEGQRGLLPAFVVRRPLGGTIVTSMPFLDGGGPCGTSPMLADGLVERLLAEARRVGASAVEIRSSVRLGVAWTPLEHKVNMTLTLPENPSALWDKFEKGIRNQVRKAERSSLSVVVGGVELLDGFYGVFVSRMRELGSPVHAREFFREMLEAFRERAGVVLVMKGSDAIGGLIALKSHDTIVVPWASCATEYRALCPNMLLYWETIRLACLEGYRQFDFGRSTRDSGTYKFKRQWGAEERPLFWYTIPLRQQQRITDRVTEGHSSTATRLSDVWRRLPLAWTRRLGPHVRKYLVQ